MGSQRRSVTPQEIEDGKQWIHEVSKNNCIGRKLHIANINPFPPPKMYRMADAKNVEMVNIFLNEDAILNFSNAPPLQGRAALERLYVWEYGACPRIDHR